MGGSDGVPLYISLKSCLARWRSRVLVGGGGEIEKYAVVWMRYGLVDG